MATAPAFASTPSTITPSILGSAETSLTVPTNASSLLSAGASGTLIVGINVQAVTNSLTPGTVAGLIYVFLYDGTTYHLYDTIAVTAVTASTTVAPFATSKAYSNLWLKSGWSLRASQSIAGNASLLKVTPQATDL